MLGSVRQQSGSTHPFLQTLPNLKTPNPMSMILMLKVCFSLKLRFTLMFSFGLGVVLQIELQFREEVSATALSPSFREFNFKQFTSNIWGNVR